MTMQLRAPLLSIVLFGLGCLASGALGQTYSESTGYRPTALTKDDRKKLDKKSATSSVANVASDITVTIPLAVMDHSGTYNLALTKADVGVFVDDVEVPIASFDEDKQPLNVVLLIDSSPSANEMFKTIKQDASLLVASLPADAKVAVVDFNDGVKVRCALTTDRGAAQTAISKIRMANGTSLYEGIEALYQRVLSVVPGRKVVILFSDGVDTTSDDSTYGLSLREVEKEDVAVYPVYYDTFIDINKRDIGTGSFSGSMRELTQRLPPARGSTAAEYKIGRSYINDLATASGGRIFFGGRMQDATRSLLDEWANRYYVTIRLPRKTLESRRLRVRVNRPSVAVFARGSFIEN